MYPKCDWWIHLGYMLRLHSKCTPNVIGGYIGGKVIQSLQFAQDVPTGFQGTSPPVYLALKQVDLFLELIDLHLSVTVMILEVLDLINQSLD